MKAWTGSQPEPRHPASVPPTPQPWRPDGEGWAVYLMATVRGLDGWEIWAMPLHMHGPVPAADQRWAPCGDRSLVYARPTPELPGGASDGSS